MNNEPTMWLGYIVPIEALHDDVMFIIMNDSVNISYVIMTKSVLDTSGQLADGVLFAHFLQERLDLWSSTEHTREGL